MGLPLKQFARNFVLLFGLVLAAACSAPRETGAAPYAAFVMDARTGQTLYAENADARLHPASLTKMMTLYIAFQEIEKGNLSLDSVVTVTPYAASQPPSRLGLKAGQKIQMRYLIRAAAIKSANDAAAAIGDHISGNQQAFAKRMTKTARAMGMKNTTFKNANGLTQDGHLSSAHDMTILGRHVIYDFPQYYNLFSRRTADAGIAEVQNTNRRFLDAYAGADGIKTGYTVAAGFNLTASAERDGKRIVASVFGGKSTAHRNAKMAELLDLGFRKAGTGAAQEPETALIADAGTVEADDGNEEGGTAKTVRVVMTVSASPRPKANPGMAPAAIAVAAAETAPAPEAAVEPAETEVAVAEPAAEAVAVVAEVSTEEPAETEVAVLEVDPGSVQSTAAAPANSLQGQAQAIAEGTATGTDPLVTLASASPRPPKRKAPIYEDATVVAAVAPAEQEVVTRVSTSGGRDWGITVGRYNTRAEAERVLLKTQLAETATLNDSLRKVVSRGGGYEATFAGLTQDQADLACRRLAARSTPCFTLGP